MYRYENKEYFYEDNDLEQFFVPELDVIESQSILDKIQKEGKLNRQTLYYDIHTDARWCPKFDLGAPQEQRIPNNYGFFWSYFQGATHPDHGGSGWTSAPFAGTPLWGPEGWPGTEDAGNYYPNQNGSLLIATSNAGLVKYSHTMNINRNEWQSRFYANRTGKEVYLKFWINDKKGSWNQNFWRDNKGYMDHGLVVFRLSQKELRNIDENQKTQSNN